MTLPEQSDRAVAQTRAFLVRLASPFVEGGIKGIRREIRAEALALLRHYPYSYRESDENRGNGDMSGAWISVSERLPEDGQSVIVFWSKYREVGEAVFGKVEGLFSTDRGGCYDVSHWMPLPSPPEVTP
jgi:hypothetical protein